MTNAWFWRREPKASSKSTSACSGEDWRRTRGNAVNVAAPKSDTVAMPEGAIKSRRQEGIAHRRWGMSLEKRAGRGEREQLDDGPPSCRGADGFTEHDPHALNRRLQSLLAPACHIDRGKHPIQGLRRTFDGAEKVQAHDVPRSFPDRVHRRLAIEQREAAIFHIGVATQALHSLEDQRRSDLTHPIFGDRRHQPPIG